MEPASRSPQVCAFGRDAGQEQCLHRRSLPGRGFLRCCSSAIPVVCALRHSRPFRTGGRALPVVCPGGRCRYGGSVASASFESSLHPATGPSARPGHRPGCAVLERFLAMETRRPDPGVAIMGLYLAGFARQALRHHGHPWQNLRIAIEHDYLPGDRIVFDALYAQVPLRLLCAA